MSMSALSSSPVSSTVRLLMVAAKLSTGEMCIILRGAGESGPVWVTGLISKASQSQPGLQHAPSHRLVC